MDMAENITSAWDEWELVEHLGSGRFGRVYKAKNKSHLAEMYSAIKIISIPSEDDRTEMESNAQNEAEKRRQLEESKNDCVREIEIMIQLRESPNVVYIEDYKVIEVIENSGDIGYQIHIRMDLLTALDAYISENTENGRLTDDGIIKLGVDICSALELCAAQSPPIIHRDIKSDNILVTKSGTYKLGDFGIARWLDNSPGTRAGTGHYMAPEVCAARPYGAGADICSLGIVLYVLSNNKRLPLIDPHRKTAPLKRENDEACFRRLQGEPLPPPANAGEKLAQVILRACAHDPEERYATAAEFKAALVAAGEPEPSGQDDAVKGETPGEKDEKRHGGEKTIKNTNVTKLLISALVVSVLVAAGYFGSVVLDIFGVDVLALEIEPQYVTLTLQQTSGLTIRKIMENGDITIMNPNNLTWTTENSSVARIDGNRIVGLNIGKTVIEGVYQDQRINVIVNVIEPAEDFVDIVQMYELGRKVTLFGGTLSCEHIDGALSGAAEFVSPGSIDTAEDGTVYIADSRILRTIKNNMVKSIEIEPFYMTPDIVRCLKNDIYILTHPWEETDGEMKYGIVKLGAGDKAEEVYIADAHATDIPDFGFLPDDANLLYFIERNAVLEETKLKTVSLRDTANIQTLCALPDGTQSLAFGGDGAIYLANPETGVIQYYKGGEGGELKYFAGVAGERAFVDGGAPIFFMPQKIRYADGFLYVWDFNVLRRIKIEDGTAGDCLTVAGEASPDFDFEGIQTQYNAEEVILPNSKFCEFAVTGDMVLLTDPKRGLIWKLE